MDNDWTKEIEIVDDSEFHKTPEAENAYQKRMWWKLFSDNFLYSWMQIFKWVILLGLWPVAIYYKVTNQYIIFGGAAVMFSNLSTKYYLLHEYFCNFLFQKICLY